MATLARRSLGRTLLGIWLILYGILPLLTISIPNILMHLLAVVAGALLVAGR